MSQDHSPDLDPEHGEPILLLRDIEQETSPVFLQKIRHKIHRRVTVSQMLAFSWNFPSTVLFELGALAQHILTSFNTRNGGRRR